MPGAADPASRAVEALEAPLWRAVGLFRVLALGYAVLVFAQAYDDARRPALGWAVLAGMAAWTAAVTVAYRAPAGRSRAVVAADLAVACAALLATRVVDEPARIEAGAQTLPVIWPAAAVLAWALRGGPRAGAAAAAAVGAVGLVVRGAFAGTTLHNIVLLLLVGTIVGHAVALARRAERRLAVALEAQAASRERERLARAVHDGVLQVLALVQRRGAEADRSELAELARLAGEQEAALRALVTSPADPRAPLTPPPDGTGPAPADLRTLLAPYSSPQVSLAAPATPVRLPARAAREVADAVGAALDNVRRHAPGAHAWVLVEEEPDAVVVSVRDDGPGFPPGRLEEAAAAGRLGVARSIRGRVADLAGSVDITSAPGAGTEVELRVPRGLRR